jgi:outer membrane protein assembly factor BamA
MLAALDGCRRGAGKTPGPKPHGPRSLLLLVVVVLLPPFLVSPSQAQTYEEKEYRDSFSTDFFFPYLDYNEKAIGFNLFDKNTFFGDSSDSGVDKDDWRREVGGSLTFSFPLDLYHRIVPGYEISWIDLPDESERLNGILLSLVRDTADYYIMEIISGSQVNLTAKYGNKVLGSERSFQSYAGDLRFYTNLDMREYFGAGQRLVTSLRLHGGVKKDDPRLFVLGGEDSLRGYDFNEFSGEKMWAASLELRYPFLVIDRTTTAWDFFHFQQLLALAFVDSGQIWREYGDSSSVSGAEVGVGGGVRLQMFLFGKIPFTVGFDVAQSVTDTERDPKVYLVLRLGG